MTAGNGEMGFWEHVEALRGVLLRIVVTLSVLTVAYFCVMGWMFDHVILAPCSNDFILYRLLEKLSVLGDVMPDAYLGDFTVSLINIKLASQFFTHVSTSFWLALVTAFPIMLYQLWLFVSPGLYPRERRPAAKAFALGCGMFYLGVAAGYFIVFPLTLRFLADYRLSESIPNEISLDSYMDNFLMLIFALGIVFELPLLAWLLGKIGLLKRSMFSRYRRYAIVTLLVIAAVITPTGDPFTLMVVFLPIYMLWEAGALLVPKEE